MDDGLNLLILSTAEAPPTVNWVMVIAGLLLLGGSLLMYLKMRK